MFKQENYVKILKNYFYDCIEKDIFFDADLIARFHKAALHIKSD